MLVNYCLNAVFDIVSFTPRHSGPDESLQSDRNLVEFFQPEVKLSVNRRKTRGARGADFAANRQDARAAFGGLDGMVQRGARLRCKGHPTGVTTFIARYRVGDRQQMTTIGWTNTLQAEAARKRPRERMGRAATVNNLAARVLEIYLPHHPKETTQLDYRKMIERFIIPRLGRYKVAEPDRTKIAVFHHSISATPYQAHRALAALSVMLLQAETLGDAARGCEPLPACQTVP